MSSYLFYGYSSPTDGTYSIDGKQFYSGIDFRNVKRYKEYKDVGFNMLLLQRNDPYQGEDFETSNLKRCMDAANEAGIDKIVVTDNRLYDLSSKTDSLIGKGKAFLDKSELDMFVKKCVKDYSKHPAFFGLMLRDEPHYEHFSAIQDLQESIKRVLPNCFIQCNLLPSLECARPFFGSNKGGLYKEYNDYVSTFMSMMPQNNISMDYYPFKANENGFYFDNNFFFATKVLADQAKKYDKDITFVLQSCEITLKGKPFLRRMNYHDLLLCINISMAYAAKGIAFFTYWRKQLNETNGEYFEDGSSFITNNGKKTKIYHYVKKIFNENYKLLSSIENLKYEKALITEDKFFTFDHLVIKNDDKANLLITSIGKNINSIVYIGNSDNSDVVKDIIIDNIADFNILKCDGHIKRNHITLKCGDAIFLERR